MKRTKSPEKMVLSGSFLLFIPFNNSLYKNTKKIFQKRRINP